jgi:prophage endopeptidase
MSLSPFRMALIAMLIGALVPLYWFIRVVDQRDDAVNELRPLRNEVAGLREAARITGEMLAERDAIDQRNTTELNHALDENQRLRRAVDDGRQRLFVKATCPATGSVPATATTARVVDAGAAELSADARPDYFALRDQLAKSRQMILGLQQYVAICQRAPSRLTDFQSSPFKGSKP